MPTTQQQAAVAAYFAEANAPTVIGTAEAQTHIVDTTAVAGRSVEQIGRSQRLLNLAKLAAADPQFTQAVDALYQAFGAVSRDCGEIQRLTMILADHAAAIDAANTKAKAVALALGYVL